MGIVTQVVEDAELLTNTQNLITRLAAGPTKAFGKAKRLLYDGWTETLEGQLECESRTIATIAHTSDTREGIKAFIEKRPARFTGD